MRFVAAFIGAGIMDRYLRLRAGILQHTLQMPSHDGHAAASKPPQIDVDEIRWLQPSSNISTARQREERA
jgi:hypothetical protein